MVGYYHGYIQVHKNGYWEEPILDNGFLTDSTLESKLRNGYGIHHYSARLEAFALISTGENTKGCLVSGIEPEKEKQLISLDKRVSQGVYPNHETPLYPIALIGEGLANRLKTHLNDTILLLGQGYHGSLAAGKFIIKTILKFGAPELNANILFITLPEARKVFGNDLLTTSFVVLPNSIPEASILTGKLSHAIGKEFEVMEWPQMLPEVDQHIRTDKGSLFIISLVIYLLVASGMLGTLFMMIAERQREFGILIALGMQRRILFMVLVLESLLEVILGVSIGILLSIPSVWLLKVHPIRFGEDLSEMFIRYGFEPIFPASLKAEIFIQQAELMIGLALVISLLPLLKVLSLDPVKAIKK